MCHNVSFITQGHCVIEHRRAACVCPVFPASIRELRANTFAFLSHETLLFSSLSPNDSLSHTFLRKLPVLLHFLPFNCCSPSLYYILVVAANISSLSIFQFFSTWIIIEVFWFSPLHTYFVEYFIDLSLFLWSLVFIVPPLFPLFLFLLIISNFIPVLGFSLIFFLFLFYLSLLFRLSKCLWMFITICLFHFNWWSLLILISIFINSFPLF